MYNREVLRLVTLQSDCKVHTAAHCRTFTGLCSQQHSVLELSFITQSPRSNQREGVLHRTTPNHHKATPRTGMCWFKPGQLPMQYCPADSCCCCCLIHTRCGFTRQQSTSLKCHTAVQWQTPSHMNKRPMLASLTVLHCLQCSDSTQAKGCTLWCVPNSCGGYRKQPALE